MTPRIGVELLREGMAEVLDYTERRARAAIAELPDARYEATDVIETPEGARMMVQVADCDPESVQAGMMVALEFRLIRKEGKGGILCYGHKAVPAYPMGGEAEAELRAGETEVAHA